jgi:hypothetical protein
LAGLLPPLLFLRLIDGKEIVNENSIPGIGDVRPGGLA